MTPYRRYNHLCEEQPEPSVRSVRAKGRRLGVFELQCILCGVLLAGALAVKLVGGNAYAEMKRTLAGWLASPDRTASVSSSVPAVPSLPETVSVQTQTQPTDLSVSGDQLEQAVEYIRKLLPSGIEVDEVTVEQYARTYLENLSKQYGTAVSVATAATPQPDAQMSIDEVLQQMSELSGGASTVVVQQRVETVVHDGDLVPTALLTGTDLKKTDTFAQKADGGLLEAPEGTSFAPFFPSVELRNPLDIDFRISSKFGYRYHPVTGMFGFHTGVDLPAAAGTYIYAAAAGTVIESGYSSVWGNYLLIRHDDHTETFYAHCKKLRREEGDRVKKGQIIATVGSTGMSTGAHLHYEVRIDGVHMDPQWILQM